MAYIKIDTANGPAYFEQLPNGQLAAISNPTVLRDLNSGKLPVQQQQAIAGGAQRFASQPQPVTQPAAQPTAQPLPSLPPAQAQPQQTQPTLPQFQAPTLPTLTLPERPGPSNLAAFAAALNDAVNLARTKRNKFALEFFQGNVPAGALPATSFGQLLGNINAASAQFTQPLVAGALGAEQQAREEQLEDFRFQRDFAVSQFEFDRAAALEKAQRDYELQLQQFSQQQRTQEQERNAIRDLYISLAQEGVGQETLQNILNSGSLDTALRIAGPALNKSGSKDYQYFQQPGGRIVAANKNDPSDTYVVFEPAPSSTGAVTETGVVTGLAGAQLVDDSGKPIKLTGTQLDTLAGFDTTIQGANDALALLDLGVETGPVAGRTLQFKKTINQADPNQLKLEQLLGKIKADFMKALSGAAVSEQEVQRLSKFLPEITDQEDVIRSKLNSLIESTQKQRKTYFGLLGASTQTADNDPLGIR